MANKPFDARDEIDGSGIIVNPGTGPVRDANEVDAFNNMVKLCADAGVLDKLDMPDAIVRMRDRDAGDGRLAFVVSLGERECTVDMPGIPLVSVRYTHAPEQDIWDFPRLYVDGSSWLWCFAVSRVRESLLGEDAET